MTGVLIGFVGVAVIADLDPTNLVTDGHGVALVLVSALAWALGTVLLYDRTPTLSLPAEGAWMMLVGAVLLHVASFVQREPLPAALTLEIVAVVGYLAAVSGVGGYLLYLFLLDALGPIEVSLLEYVIPLFAALVGWFALGELLSTSTVVGFGLIVVGFFIVKRSALLAELRRRQNHRKRPRIE
jgi:drug/metabolite transporter (DMT)-like permease